MTRFADRFYRTSQDEGSISMTNPFKDAVICIAAMNQYLEGRVEDDGNGLIPMTFSLREWCSIITALSAGRGLADGSEVIAPADYRKQVLREAAKTAAEAAWKHVGEDAYSKGMDAGAVHQVAACFDAILALAASPQTTKELP
jgi:hypothetical protein